MRAPQAAWGVWIFRRVDPAEGEHLARRRGGETPQLNCHHRHGGVTYQLLARRQRVRGAGPWSRDGVIGLARAAHRFSAQQTTVSGLHIAPRDLRHSAADLATPVTGEHLVTMTTSDGRAVGRSDSR